MENKHKSGQKCKCPDMERQGMGTGTGIRTQEKGGLSLLTAMMVYTNFSSLT